jgi:anti-sigma factor RsiW
MDCREAKMLLDPYLDRELDAAVARHVDEHLDLCPACGLAREQLLTLRSAARDLREAVPLPLAMRVRCDARTELTDGRLNRAVRAWRAVAVAASLIAAVSIGWAVLAGRGGPSQASGTLADELVAGHVRSLMAAHLLDVVSSDRHTVKPWFLGKLDFSPDVRDFREAGFPLIGGRVDYVGGRPVAALVYQHQKHVINAFTWAVAANDRPMPPPASDRQGYHVLAWRDGEMMWCVVSDASESALHDLRARIQDHAAPAPGASTTPVPAAK